MVFKKKFIGANISEPVKDALKAEADRREISMSAYICKLLTTEMKRKGYGVGQQNKINRRGRPRQEIRRTQETREN